MSSTNGISPREAIRSLIESPFYFRMDILSRLALVKEVISIKLVVA